jgi:hypothetical protein
VAIEVATVPFDTAALKINHDWGTTLDGKQLQRWGERIGTHVVRRREEALHRFEKKNILPACKHNEHEILAIGMDGGRVQKRLKNQDGTRWSEDKVLTITSYLKGDGGDIEPRKLVSSYLATMEHAEKFGRLARLESERRGIRNAAQVIVLGDGAAWIDTVAQEHFACAERIVDWYHAAEHLHEAARARHANDELKQSELAERLKSLLWDGAFDALMDELRELSAWAGTPPGDATASDPRKIMSTTIGYFEKRREQMDYPRYRKNGWPIGSGVTEAGVKLFNKRVKGTEQFWNEAGVEAILSLRSEWLNDPEGLHHRLWPTPTKIAA